MSGKLFVFLKKVTSCRFAPTKTETETEPESELSQEAIDNLWEVKKERTRRLRAKKQHIAECEERFTLCIKTFNNIIKNMLGGNIASVEDALAFVNQMSGLFLEDRESTLHLMNVMAPSENAYSHPMNVAILSMMVGREAGLSKEEMTALGMGALFHDIGKAQIPKNS